MLSFGTLSYRLSLAAAMPVWISIDEDPARPRPMGRVIVDVLAAMMAMLIGLEILRQLT
jgi:hypothetical protein